MSASSDSSENCFVDSNVWLYATRIRSHIGIAWSSPLQLKVALRFCILRTCNTDCGLTRTFVSLTLLLGQSSDRLVPVMQ